MSTPITSPWGAVQTATEYDGGICFVSTPGHGGFFVPDELLAGIPEKEQQYAEHWSGSKNWYEEDCAALSVMFWLNDKLRARHPLDTIKGYWEELAKENDWQKGNKGHE